MVSLLRRNPIQTILLRREAFKFKPLSNGIKSQEEYYVFFTIGVVYININARRIINK